MERCNVQNKDEHISPADRVFNIPELVEKILEDHHSLQTFSSFNFLAKKILLEKHARFLQNIVHSKELCNFVKGARITDDGYVILRAMELAPDTWKFINYSGPLSTDREFLLRAMELAPDAWKKIRYSDPLSTDREFLLRAMELAPETRVLALTLPFGPLSTDKEFLLRAMKLALESREGH